MSESSFRVLSHLRPLLKRERDAACCVAISCLSDSPSIQVHNSSRFDLDAVYNDDRLSLFEAEVLPLISCFRQGYNCCLLASGQTSSGKSYTMGFSHDDEVNAGGIASLSFKQLESTLAQATGHREVKLTASFIEVYQDKIRDLLSSAPKSHTGSQGSHLAPIRPLSAISSRRNSSSSQVPSHLSPSEARRAQLHQNASISVRDPDPRSEVRLVGVEEISVTSAEEMKACLNDGLFRRATASTLANDSSSRSHAIFILRLYQGPVRSSEEEEALQSTLYLCDLAGSERLNRSGASGLRLSEACSINGGLLALSNVIMALSDPQRNHIPYRDHVLTRILRSALGGNAKTLYLACLSPSDVDIPESLNTLQYATRCRMIKQSAKINKIKEGSQTSALVSSLKMEVEELKSLLLMKESDQSKADGRRDSSALEADLVATQMELEAERSHVVELEAANMALKLKLAQSENAQSHLRNQLDQVLVLTEEHMAEGEEVDEEEEKEEGGGRRKGDERLGLECIRAR